MTAKDLYPDFQGSLFCITDYDPIVKSFGTVAVKVDDDDYHGDSRILYDNAGKIGYLQFGWGSCSGCDALQACETYEAVDELIEELRGQIRWFDDARDALDFFKTHDWGGDYNAGRAEQREFIQKSIDYLEEQTNEN